MLHMNALDWRAVGLTCAAIFTIQIASGYILPKVFPAVKSLQEAKLVALRACLGSMFHSMFGALSSFWLFTKIQSPSPGFEKQVIPQELIRFVGSIFFGYMVHDLIHNMGYHGRHFGSKRWEQIFHHVLFMVIVVLHSSSSEMNFAFPFVYVGELSTVFLDMRFFFKSIGYPKLHALSSKLFALSFFLTRIVLFGWFCGQIFVNWNAISKNVESLIVRSSLSILFPIALVLQMFWMIQIGNIVRALGSSQKKGE